MERRPRRVKTKELLRNSEPVEIVCSAEDLVRTVAALEEHEGVPDVKIHVSLEGEIFVNGRKVLTLKPHEDAPSRKPSPSPKRQKRFQALFFFRPTNRTDINLPFSLSAPAFKELPDGHQNRILDCLSKAFHSIGGDVAADNLVEDLLFSPCPLTMLIDIPIVRLRKYIRGQELWSNMGLKLSSDGVLRLQGIELVTFQRYAGITPDSSIRVLQHAIFRKAHLYYVRGETSQLFTDELRKMVWDMLMAVMSELVN